MKTLHATVLRSPGLRVIPAIVGIASSPAGMIVAGWLVRESDRNRHAEFTVTDAELAEACGLTVDEVRGARADITTGPGRRVFEYTTKGFPRRGWWRVDAAALGQATVEAA